MLFTTFLFAGSGVIACWCAARFPQAAPASLTLRGAGALVSAEALSLAPVVNHSYFWLYCSVFGILLPLLTIMWLHIVWLLQALREVAELYR